MQVELTVNGRQRTDEVEPRLLLVHYLREVCGLRAANVGCDTTSCGACTVLLNGTSVKSCTVLTVQANGQQVTTAEGLASNGDLHPGHGDGRGRPAVGEPGPHRGRGPGRAGGQLLPLHRLPQHRARGAGRRRSGRRDGGGRVIPAPFDYVAAQSPAHALDLLDSLGDEAKLLAGGHSLLPVVKLRLATPSVLIDLGRVARRGR